LSEHDAGVSRLLVSRRSWRNAMVYVFAVLFGGAALAAGAYLFLTGRQLIREDDIRTLGFMRKMVGLVMVFGSVPFSLFGLYATWRFLTGQ
jgi:hypothetical protein